MADYGLECVSAPVMIHLGASDLRTLYATMAQFPWLADHPGAGLSGKLYRMETAFPGVPEPKFVSRA